MKTQVRKVKISDAAAIAGIYSYYADQTVISFEAKAPSPEEMAHRIQKYAEKFPWIVLEEESVIVGYAYASPFRERAAYRFTVELSVYLSKDHCQKGYGRVLTEELLLLLQQSGYYTAIAGITETNQASIAFFKKMGFKPCAEFVNVGYKMGQWLSVLMLYKELQDGFTEMPKEPILP